MYLIFRISASIMRQATYGTIKFGSYYSLKQSATDRWGTDDLVLINIVCAAVAGAVSSAIANPTDVVKVRMQVTGVEANLTLFSCFQDVYNHEGVRGLWRVNELFSQFHTFISSFIQLLTQQTFLLQGVGPTAQRAAIIAAVELPIYDFSKKELIPYLGNSVFNHFL